jgi:hypothetical protein
MSLVIFCLGQMDQYVEPREGEPLGLHLALECAEDDGVGPLERTPGFYFVVIHG